MPTPTTKTIPNIPKEISWRTQSRPTPHRSPVWYLGFAIVSVAGLIFAIFYNQSIITVITFVLIILVVLIMTGNQGGETSYRLTALGINAGRIEYPYKTIKKFWLDYRPPEIKTLNIETTASINNRISLQLGNQDPVEVKLFLSRYLREDLDREESLTEALARRLKI